MRQVELVVQEGALREFARLRQPQADILAGFQAARQQHLHDYRPAVPLQLQHVFAGVRMRRFEIDRQPLVDHAAIGMDEAGIGRMARLQHACRRQAAQRGDQVGDAAPGKADHADAAASGCGGDGGDR